MINITVNKEQLTLEVHGIDALWTLNSQLQIPLTHVMGVALDPVLAAQPPQEHSSPIHPPHVAAVGTVGTFLQKGRRVFWDVRDPDKAIIIDLKDEEYAQLVVEVEDPRTVMAQIEDALEHQLET